MGPHQDQRRPQLCQESSDNFELFIHCLHTSYWHLFMGFFFFSGFQKSTWKRLPFRYLCFFAPHFFFFYHLPRFHLLQRKIVLPLLQPLDFSDLANTKKFLRKYLELRIFQLPEERHSLEPNADSVKGAELMCSPCINPRHSEVLKQFSFTQESLNLKRIKIVV